MTTTERRLLPFVGEVLARSNLDYTEFKTDLDNGFDGRRISISLDNEEFNYFIRTWNMTDYSIRFTFFKDTPDNFNHGAQELFSGCYCISIYKEFD